MRFLRSVKRLNKIKNIQLNIYNVNDKINFKMPGKVIFYDR